MWSARNISGSLSGNLIVAWMAVAGCLVAACAAPRVNASPPASAPGQDPSGTDAVVESGEQAEADGAAASRALQRMATGSGSQLSQATAEIAYPEVWWRHDGVDHETLKALMTREEFSAPSGFRVFVVEFTLDDARTHVVRERAFDWSAASDRIAGWNVASSIKVYAAVAALVRTRERGFSPAAEVSFAGRTPVTTTVRQLVEDAVIDSDNMAYNRLVQLAGYDWLNESFFTAANGFTRSAINKAYEQSTWKKQGESIELRHAPEITLREGELELVVPKSTGESKPACGGSACTTLQDLAEAMRRLAMHELLPPDHRFGLEPDDLVLLREALAAPRRRGEGVAEMIKAAFPDADIHVLHKPGYSEGWFSEIVYIGDDYRNHAWVIAITAHSGRDGLDEAALKLGGILAFDDLLKATAKPERDD